MVDLTCFTRDSKRDIVRLIIIYGCHIQRRPDVCEPGGLCGVLPIDLCSASLRWRDTAKPPKRVLSRRIELRRRTTLVYVLSLDTRVQNTSKRRTGI